jgi:dihydroorotase
MAHYARRIGDSFGRILVMPNLLPPITTPESVTRYADAIQHAAPGLKTLMTFKLMPGMGPSEIKALKGAGAIAGKYYPEGVTTNAEDGIRGTRELYPILEHLEAEDLVLCIHGETPDAPVLDRERAFLPQLEEMADRFPRLRMVFEHVSSAEAVDLVDRLPSTVAATVTAHHMLFTLEDMMASGLDPHLYCKPLVKTEADRAAIERVVLEGHPKFFFGSDSAPHPVEAKTGPRAAAGVYSAPVAFAMLIEFFESREALDRLESFTSCFGAEFYRIERNSGVVEWRRAAWEVPATLDGVVPLMAGKTVAWQKK